MQQGLPEAQVVQVDQAQLGQQATLVFLVLMAILGPQGYQAVLGQRDSPDHLAFPEIQGPQETLEVQGQ